MTDLFQENNTMQYFQDRGNEERQNQIDIINKIVSPDFIENEKQKGKVTAFETLSNAKKWGYAVPYIGTGADIANSFKIKGLQDKVKDGVQLTSEEMDTYKDFVLDVASQSARGQTIPSMAWDGFLQSVPYMVEFGVGIATSAEGVGLASLGSTGGKLAVKKAIKEGVVGATKEAVKKKIANTTAKTLLKDSTIGVAKFNAKYLPQQGVKRYAEIEVDNNLFVTPEGQVLLNEAESKPATSVLKAIALMQIETLSETAGYAFNFGGKVLGKFIDSKVLKRLPDKFVKNLNKLTKQVSGLSTVKALEKFGWNGILEEYGEERVSDLLQTTFDLDGEKGYSFEQFLQALLPPKEQAIAELLSFAIMGGTGAGIKRGVDYSRYKKIAGEIQEQSKNQDGSYNTDKMKRLVKKHNPNITEENLNKAINSVTNGITKTEDYSVDDFLLDCGVFRMHARKSNTDERLTQILQEGGVKEEAIEEFLDHASLDDKAELLKMHDETTADRIVDYSALKNDLINSGHSEEQAELEIQSLDRVDEIMMNKYNAEGEAENLIKNRNLKIQSLQNEVQKKKEEEYIQKSDLKQKEIHHFKPSELEVDAKTFQYKENSDEEGRTDRLSGIEEWSAKGSGIVIVYETKDGTRYIADGHQRLALAKKLNDDTIRLDGLLYREIDGYTPSDIRLEAAKKNIAEGSGTPIDTAKIIRELGGIENYPASLPRTGTMYEYGYSLSRLGDEAFEKVVNRYVTPAQGAIIANIIRADHNKQSLAIDVIAKEGIETLSETELMARQILSLPTETVEQTNLFGTQEIFQSSAVEKIKIIDGALKRLQKSKNLMAHLASNSKAIENNGNRLNKENNENLKRTAETAFEVIKKQAFYVGAISDKAGELAQKNKNGEISFNQAVLDFCDFCMQDNILNIILGGEQESEKEISFYQSAKNSQEYLPENTVDLTNEFDRVPTFEEVKNHLFEIMNNGTSFDTKTKGYKIDIKQTDVSRGGKKPTNVINKLTKKGDFKYNKSSIKRNNKYLVAVEKLINNSIKTLNSEVNKKPELKKHVKAYYNFDVPVKISDVIYQIRLQTEEWINDKPQDGIKTVHLYNMYEYKKSSTVRPESDGTKPTREDFKDNLTYSNADVNDFYQFANPNIYKQDYRGQSHFRNNETIIELAKGHDASTFMHELAHLYLHDLQELAKTNKRAEKDLHEIYEKFDFNSSEHTQEEFRDMHEKFARSFEAYLLNGESPTARMKSIFEKFKEFLHEVYDSLSDLNVEFSSEIKQCFDKLLATDEEYENEVLPLYQQNDELADSINSQETLSYKIKNNINSFTEMWKSFYDTVIVPIDTRLGRISPQLKQLLRKHTFDLTYQSKKDCDKITPFLLKIKEIKNSKKMIEFNGTQFNAYNLLSYALNNRDSYTVNKVVKILGIESEFEQVREILDELHDETVSVGLETGYLESYYPRMVKTDKTEAFVDLFERMAREEEIDIKNQLLELDEAQYSDVKRTIKDNDVHGLWNSADKAKLINTSIRGFGKNNIMLSRIGQLKFERQIDKLTPEQQRFYEPIEKALSNYVIGARKNIEERKFFGAENKEVGKLRASIKRKRETLREVKTRTPAQAKWKELNRLKYELAPIEIKLETISGELKNNIENVKTIKDKEQKEKVKGYIQNQREMIEKLTSQAERLKSQIEWTEKSNSLKVKYSVIRRINAELSNLSKQIEEILGDVNHVEDSVGRLIADLAEKNVIHVKDERVIRDLLVSRFNTLRLEKFALTVRDASTIVTLNDITNAITQITDLTFSAFKFGLFDTVQGMRKVEGLTREDLGINNIAEEFRGSSGLSNWLNKQLKIIGLDLIDGFAKNVAVNASVLSARKKAKKNDTKFNEKLEFLFEENASKVKQDLIDGKTTDEIIYIAFNDLADIQPISTDQMTRGYMSGFKPLYVLKTYSLKALDIVRNECFMKISQGIKSMKNNEILKGQNLIAEGIGNIIKLQIFMWLFGIPQDLLKDLIANRDFDIPEHVIDNLLIFGIFNRFLVSKVSENPANIWLENVKLPVLQAVADLTSGIQRVQKGKQEVKDMYVWSRVPIVGKLYYNWLGGRKHKRVELN